MVSCVAAVNEPKPWSKVGATSTSISWEPDGSGPSSTTVDNCGTGGSWARTFKLSVTDWTELESEKCQLVGCSIDEVLKPFVGLLAVSSRVESVGAVIERDGFRAAFKSGLRVADDIERVCLTLTCTSHAE
jgi:hypothetical protein